MTGKAFRPIACVVVALALSLPGLASEMTWSQTAREKIESLNITEEQRTDLRDAFTAAEDSYDKAITKTREKIAKTLTDDQKDKLRSMADDAIQ